ncbi:VanZ family protein [Faecalibaculum rodentium]|uniref:VanZ family protein n=1 Tax=Faecalibaculum rodentium TaxID=1702221 RepID=UPI00261240B0|nr:VanZ family protein [Faecalibaculum rodentium]
MKILKWIIRLLLAGAVCIMALMAGLAIFTFSAETGEVSGQRSGQLTEWIRDNVQEHIESSPEGRQLAEKVKGFVVRHSPWGDDWNQNIRTLAHFSEYFLMATLIYLILTILRVPWWLKAILVIMACGGLACLDELHQSDVAGRVMSKKDVLIDTSGAVFATLTYGILGRFWKWLGS